MAGLLGKIKSDAKKAGSNKGKLFYVREGEKRRIRFLSDVDDGVEVVFHDSFEAGVNQPCQERYGRDCEYCETEGIRTRSQYVWPIWDYDAKEVKLFMFPMNNCSPLPPLVALHENYGTIVDRDYVLSVSGKAQNKSYSVIPMDKAKFRNEKAKPLSEKAILQIVDKAYPTDNSKDDEDDEEMPTKTKKASKDADGEYDDMSAKELYSLCREREIDVATKKPASYYINKLEEWDEQFEEDDVDDGENWADDEDDGNEYESMDAFELYKLCKEKGIEAIPKKPQKYYINLLVEYDEANEDWGDEDDEEDDGEWC